MSSEIFINITKEKKEMTNVQLENEIDCKSAPRHSEMPKRVNEQHRISSYLSHYIFSVRFVDFQLS